MGMINNQTNVTLELIESIANSTTIPEFFVKVNHTIYQGWLFFILMLLLWYILFIAAQKVKDQPLNNAMYSGAFITVLSFILRAIYIIQSGIRLGLMTDHQLWIFPVVTALLALVIHSMKDR